ncbi:MAG: DUF3616 domain-containing protein [Pseudonocardia sp.]|nr:MAG: DUF3616 domain-containing protein [Pseudonocardia sp.]
MTGNAALVEATVTVSLRFSRGADTSDPSAKKIAGSLSAVVQSGRCLWVCSDQTASVERLTADDPDRPGAYGEHRSYRLAEFVTLPQGDDTEVDLEGIDLQWLGPRTGFLWLVGSHSGARKQVKDDDPDEEGVQALRGIALDRNRCVLLRIPITVDGDGLGQLVSTCPDPADAGRTLAAGVLNDLLDVLADDPHLKPFRGIPGKDNGLDVEGLAIAGERVYLGLRGPVLRGWAVVLEVCVDTAGTAATGEVLRLRRWPDGDLVRKHFLDLGGLGVRELGVDGDDLLVLAGPTMVLDGPVRLLRWVGGASDDAPRLVRDDTAALRPVYELAYGVGVDQAEGSTRLRVADTSSLLMVYDSPSDQRRPAAPGSVLADVLPWP